MVGVNRSRAIDALYAKAMVYTLNFASKCRWAVPADSTCLPVINTQSLGTIIPGAEHLIKSDGITRLKLDAALLHPIIVHALTSTENHEA